MPGEVSAARHRPTGPPTRSCGCHRPALGKPRYFTGLPVEEAAEMVGLSRSAACEHWAFARAWLRCELGEGLPSE